MTDVMEMAVETTFADQASKRAPAASFSDQAVAINADSATGYPEVLVLPDAGETGWPTES